MRMMKRAIILIGLLAGAAIMVSAQDIVRLVMDRAAAPRVKFGVARLAGALQARGYRVSLAGGRRDGERKMVIRVSGAGEREGFVIRTVGNTISIDGADGSGALYGCLELAERIRNGGWPAGIHFEDHPEMALRGACIGVQKPVLLDGRGPYEYPYTPDNFPWFYDKKLWLKYLDSLAGNRMNTLYLWNGHPFASLVRLADYPYALEMDDATFARNEEMFRFLTAEADRRGIWVIQLFYNIIVSKPFAERNHLKTQDRNRPILPLIADYTRKSIAAFVEKYPNVGLMVTLGEAMEGVGQDDIDWFTGTILPGIRDGLRALGRTDEPPVVLRAHDTDAPAVMKAALPLYRNLYVEAKYNGEALTTYTPHGSWAALHQQLSHVSKGLIENVHIMANLEPFRYGSADFIQKCVEAMHSVYGASGLHLYPQASYWDWPYTADASEPRLLEMERDWIWYKTWARYAWNCHRDREGEMAYWSGLLAARYGCDAAHGKEILTAYERSGEIAPKLLRRFGITDGNRQTLSLGMLMTQLINPERYGLFSLLYESEGPVGEDLRQYADKEWKGATHMGETPVAVIADVQAAGKAAVEAIEKASGGVMADRAEFDRLRNDMYCYKALADCYAAKAGAALRVLRYKYSGDPDDLRKARPLLAASLESFRELTRLAGPAYRYANSMQTAQRKIPVRGADGKFISWGELLPLYEKELERFDLHLDSLAKSGGHGAAMAVPPFERAEVQWEMTGGGLLYRVDSGQRVFSDTVLSIGKVVASLRGLEGVRLAAERQRKEGVELAFTNKGPVDLLVGLFQQKGAGYLQAPQLETDASANDQGQADIKIGHALVIAGLPSVNVHAWSFKPGRHRLVLGKGLSVVLGFVKPLEKGLHYEAGLNEPGKKDMDWLFE